jgi:hypothetical protein
VWFIEIKVVYMINNGKQITDDFEVFMFVINIFLLLALTGFILIWMMTILEEICCTNLQKRNLELEIGNLIIMIICLIHIVLTYYFNKNVLAIIILPFIVVIILVVLFITCYFCIEGIYYSLKECILEHCINKSIFTFVGEMLSTMLSTMFSASYEFIRDVYYTLKKCILSMFINKTIFEISEERSYCIDINNN